METILFLALLATIAGLLLGYRFSPAALARSVTRDARAKLRDVEVTVESEWDLLQKSLHASAYIYRDNIIRLRMAAVSIDDFRNHIGGLRLRAVKDAGLNTLLDLQGWTYERLMKLYGVGGDTAAGVVLVVRQLSESILSSPVPFPEPNLDNPDSTTLFEQAAYLRQAQHLPNWIQWIAGTDAQLRAQAKTIVQNTSLGSWLASRSTASRFNGAVAAANALNESLDTVGELGARLASCLNAVTEVRQLRSTGVARERLIADSTQNWAFYVSAIRACIFTDEPPVKFSHVQPESRSSDGGVLVGAQSAAVARTVPMQAVIGMSPNAQVAHDPSNQPVSFDQPSTAAPLMPVPIMVPQPIGSVHGEIPIPPHPLTEPFRSVNHAAIPPPEAHRNDSHVPVSPVPVFSSPRAAPETSQAGTGWVPIGSSTDVCGFLIAAGGLYVGDALCAAAGGAAEPAQIDPGLPIIRRDADYRLSDAGYWPSYQGLSPKDRASYLLWLSTGMEDPEANLTYVFLHFYALERRALFDASIVPEVRAELPAIAERVIRLLKVHQATSSSFRSYATAFLQWLTLTDPALGTLAAGVEEGNVANGPNVELKLALAQVAVSQSGLPSHLALKWLMQDQNSWLRTPATRCPEIFGRMFQLEYDRVHPRGLKLPVNKTKLSMSYRPASASFGHEIRHSDVSLPDVTVLTKPLTELRAIADICYEKLDSYSRYVGKNPLNGESLEALVLLPVAFWSEDAAAGLQRLRQRVEWKSTVVLPLRGIIEGVGSFGGTPSKAQYAGFGAALESVGLGIEPDNRLGAATPDLQDSVAVFTLEQGSVQTALSDGYAGAALLVQLAGLIAAADGSICSKELSVLSDHLDTALSLPANERRRLLATVSLSAALRRPPTGISKRLQRLGGREREAIGEFLVAIVKADGVIAPGEVTTLEKLWKALELPKATLYSRLHDSESGSATPAPAAKSTTPRLRLDSSRVASLKKESSEVAELLGRVFAESSPEAPAIPQPEHQEPADAVTVGPQSQLGLDQKHSDLLRTLYTRPEWTRAEVEELCDERGLMVDGALERINEVAFDRFDVPLLEGDDPIIINSERTLEEMT